LSLVDWATSTWTGDWKNIPIAKAAWSSHSMKRVYLLRLLLDKGDIPKEPKGLQNLSGSEVKPS
ncbi:MAG TPA: hypothetical protein VEC93_14450, partial [Anaerolineae bacterium]|nr:hypothetical protein [Anaerolineae bacterium]